MFFSKKRAEQQSVTGFSLYEMSYHDFIVRPGVQLTRSQKRMAVAGKNIFGRDLSYDRKGAARARLVVEGKATIDARYVGSSLTQVLTRVSQLSPSLQSEVIRDVENLRWDLVNVANDKYALYTTVDQGRGMAAEDRAHLQARLAEFTRVENALRERATRLIGAIEYAVANERLMLANQRLMDAEYRQSGEITDALVTAYTRALNN